ncbi:MAG: polysaccharide biosynthesis protein [bacterium]|nr:polysaccharide biosynthesis protein [bacterium]
MVKYKNILIIGAGNAGKLLLKDIEKYHPDCKVIGFADDEIKEVNGTKILGKINELSKINKIYKVDEMIVAIPSINGELMRRILLENIKNRTSIKIVPRNQRIISSSEVRYDEVKNVNVEDFLGRQFVKKNIERIKKFYKNKTVLVTGGAGSIGSEIVKQLIDLEVRKVIVYDNSEYLIFNLDNALRELGVKDRYKLIIGNILNRNKFNSIVKEEKPDVIFHAAAYKHIHLMEENADEAILNNVIGTRNVINAAIENKVKHFTFISTDKVVNPTSIMGATKKTCEFYIKSINSKDVKLNIVRFGNVINSNGSVLPFFEKQIENCKYVTVTHKDMKRFFMSIREAAQLVIESTALSNKNSIHILNMGELLKIYEIAQCLIRSKNLIPGEDVEVKFVGIRKGEKMTEELYTDIEKQSLNKTQTKNLLILKNFEKCPFDINEVIRELEKIIENRADSVKEDLKNYLKKLFPSLKLK